MPNQTNQFQCTITGADDHTDPRALWEIAGEFRPGFVEWGILYSNSRQGIGRYPSFDWIAKLTEFMKKPDAPKFALHICGAAVRDFIAGEGDVTKVAASFKRIQVNFRQSEFPIESIKATMQRNSGKTIITQHNHANENLWSELRNFKNHAILFDQSGGCGIKPEVWPSSIDGLKCGYAGGLGPANLQDELPKILKAAGGEMNFWIDAEGKLRDKSDKFDLDAVNRHLEIAADFEDQVASIVSAY